MNGENHIQITTAALSQHFSQSALNTIINASLKQDEWRGQIGHPEFHFDDSAFDKGRKYIQHQQDIVLRTFTDPQPANLEEARAAFGRLIHAAQDFYAHSNYAWLWLQKAGGQSQPSPDDIDPLDFDILNHRCLRSGRGTLLEMAAMTLPILQPMIHPLLPKDAHANMNLDNLERGPLFPYAAAAAYKRTQIEYERITSRLSSTDLVNFTGRPI